MKTVLFLLAFVLSSCGQSSDTTQETTTVNGTIAASSPSPSPVTIQSVVDSYNQYQVSQGNDPITPGLKCTLYSIPNLPANPCILSTSISGCTVLSNTTGYTSVGSWTYLGTIDQPNGLGVGFNMLPLALQSEYETNFAITCTGYFVNADYNYHEFDLNSDDGSLLYIGGSLVVNNDGEHGIKDVEGVKYLEAQVYSIQINYFQGPGNYALILNEDGALASSASFYH